MRIAIDARYVTGRGSGIGSYTLNLCRALLRVAPDLEITMVCRPSAGRPSLAGPRVREAFFPFAPLSPATSHLLGRFLRRERFDLFHATCDVVPWYLDGRPLVATIHDINWIINHRYNSHSRVYSTLVGAFYKVNLDAGLRLARRVLTVSEASRAGIVAYAPWYAHKVRVTHNGVDAERVPRLDPDEAWRRLAGVLPRGTPFVLTVGHGSPHKNHVGAVRAFLRAFGDRPDYRMVLLRRETYRDTALRRELARAGERVKVLPHVPHDVLVALYNAARIFLHPAYFEGFGIPVLEAMAAGTPVVTSSVSAMPEVAGDAALLASPADPDALARALEDADRDAALRRRLVEAGARRVAHFTWERTARATLAAYREVV